MVKTLYPDFYGYVKEGQLYFDAKDAFNGFLYSITGRVRITVKPYKKIRSMNQNAYYWGVILTIIAKETGHTPEELHEIYKKKFLQTTAIQFKDGKTYDVAISTSLLKTDEFGRYIDRIIADASEYGINIPSPTLPVSYA